jgi:hypothetical protein
MKTRIFEVIKSGVSLIDNSSRLPLFRDEVIFAGSLLIVDGTWWQRLVLRLRTWRRVYTIPADWGPETMTGTLRPFEVV